MKMFLSWPLMAILTLPANSHELIPCHHYRNDSMHYSVLGEYVLSHRLLAQAALGPDGQGNDFEDDDQVSLIPRGGIFVWEDFEFHLGRAISCVGKFLDHRLRLKCEDTRPIPGIDGESLLHLSRTVELRATKCRRARGRSFSMPGIHRH